MTKTSLFITNKKALRSTLDGPSVRLWIVRNLLCSRSLYYTHFIKKERVNQWHTLEKGITVGNTVSHI
ncbi:hypothetical protein, partial [Streptococcus suis]